MVAGFSLPKIYPITDPQLSGLSHLEQTIALVAGGATIIQLRDKSSSSRDLFDAAQDCVDYCRSMNVTLIINDRVDIAMMVGADGVHLGQDDLPPSEARKLLGEKVMIGLSTHTLEQAVEAIELPVDYIAFGPVFPTATKTDHDRVVGMDRLSSIRKVVGDFPLVAIGGITLANVLDVLNAGAGSVAMISAIVGVRDQISKNVRSAIEIANKC